MSLGELVNPLLYINSIHSYVAMKEYIYENYIEIFGRLLGENRIYNRADTLAAILYLRYHFKQTRARKASQKWKGGQRSVLK